MRTYWVKIGLGALAVFVVGYGAVRGIQAGIAKGKLVFESSDPITIPMALVPFSVDGRDVGTFQRVTILRESPKSVSEVRIRVRLSEAVAPEGLPTCQLTLTQPGHLDLDQGFRCLAAEELAGMIPFGRVSLRRDGASPIEVPLFLDSATVGELRGADGGVISAQQRFQMTQEAAAARAQAEQVATGARRMADSIRAAVAATLEEARVQAAPRPPEP